MEWVEVTGKSVAEAKEKALDHLGVDESQAEFEVLEEPRVGLFRRTKGEARVRARIKPSHPRPKAERRDRRRGREREGGSTREAGEDTRRAAGGGTRQGGPRPKADAGGQVAPRRNRPAEGPVVSQDPGHGVDAIAGSEEARQRSLQHAVPQPPSARDEPDPREEPLSAMNDDEPRSEAPSDDGRQTEHAVDFLTGLVSAFGLPATVGSITVDENYDEIQVTGADLGILIGPRAAALDSIQELTRVVAQRRSGGRGESRLRVDIGGYRQRRREALERFTIKVAEEVQRSGVVKALEPMNSADRKVVHDTVGNLEGVSTLSEGEDPRRRVVIVPGS